MANATIISATADAIRDAANNPNGAGVGFMNIGIANNFASGLIQETGNIIHPEKGGYCPHCGKPLIKGAKFCSFCGKEV